jgi:hypothetical protein
MLPRELGEPFNSHAIYPMLAQTTARDVHARGSAAKLPPGPICGRPSLDSCGRTQKHAVPNCAQRQGHHVENRLKRSPLAQKRATWDFGRTTTHQHASEIAG